MGNSIESEDFLTIPVTTDKFYTCTQYSTLYSEYWCKLLLLKTKFLKLKNKYVSLYAYMYMYYGEGGTRKPPSSTPTELESCPLLAELCFKVVNSLGRKHYRVLANSGQYCSPSPYQLPKQGFRTILQFLRCAPYRMTLQT